MGGGWDLETSRLQALETWWNEGKGQMLEAAQSMEAAEDKLN
jgi:hypothetical protein